MYYEPLEARFSILFAHRNAPIEPCALSNAVNAEAELKCLREENQFMRRVICMLLGRESIFPIAGF